jgi:hypothetical protein
MPLHALGLNFSHRRAALLGVDPHEAFQATLIHLKPRHLRLSVYWDETAPEPAVYDPSILRWYLDEAQRRDCHIALTVGFKPQRHPAYFPPRWLTDGGSGGEPSGRLAANLLLMLERVIALLADYDVIDAWEAEHLPFLAPEEQPFGWAIDAPLLDREIAVLHDVDPRHRPVVISHPAGRLFALAWYRAMLAGDVFGCVAGWGRERRERQLSRLETWQLSIQATLAARAGRELWITELGAAAASRQNPPSIPEIIDSDLESAFRSGARRVYLRGVEEWFATRAQGRSLGWEHARELMQFAADQLP